MGWVNDWANAVAPWAQILGFLAIIAGLVVYAVKLVKWLRRQFRESRTASIGAANAARETSVLVKTLIDELAEEKELREAESSARTLSLIHI